MQNIKHIKKNRMHTMVAMAGALAFGCAYSCFYTANHRVDWGWIVSARRIWASYP